MNLFSRCALLVCLGLSPAAAAATGQSAADRETAKLLGREGHKALKAGDFDTAADRLERANNLIHAPTFLLLLARARVGQGRLVEAYDLYREVIRETVNPKMKAFRDAVNLAKKEVGPLEARLARVSVDLVGPRPDGVQITINGVTVPLAALGTNRLVDPGRVVVRAEAPGYSSSESAPIVLNEGEQGPSIELQLSALPPPLVSQPIVQTVLADRGTGTAQRTLGYITLGLGGAALVGWGVTGTLAILKHSELQDDCDTDVTGSCLVPFEKEALADEYHSYARVADYTAAAGGMLLVGGLLLLLTSPDDATLASEPHIAPFLGWGTIGASGRF